MLHRAVLLLVLVGFAAAGSQAPEDPVEEADRLARLGETEAAVAILETHLQEHPLDVDGHRTLQGLLEPEMARERYEKLLAEHPDAAEAHYLWGRVLSQGGSGDLEAGAPHFSKALELDPGLAWAAWAMALVEQRRGDNEAALARVTDGLEANPGSDQLVGFVHSMVAQFNMSSPETTRALEEALSRDPADPRRHVALWNSRIVNEPGEETEARIREEIERLWAELEEPEELESLAMFPERPPYVDPELATELWVDLQARFPDADHAPYYLVRGATRLEDRERTIELLSRAVEGYEGSAYRLVASQYLLRSLISEVRPEEAIEVAAGLRESGDRRQVDLEAHRETKMWGYPQWGATVESVGYVGWFLAAQSREADPVAEEPPTPMALPAADHLTEEGRQAVVAFRDAEVPDPWGYRFVSDELGRLETEPELRAELAELAYSALQAWHPATQILVNRGWGPQRVEREAITRIDILSEVARARAGAGRLEGAVEAADGILAAVEMAELRGTTLGSAHTAAGEAYEAAGADERALEQYMRALKYKRGDPEIEKALERLYASVQPEGDLAGDLADLRPPMEPFELEDLDGNPVSLADYRGRPVLVNFWATWCGPCVAEMPHLKKLASEYREQGFEVLAVNVDDDPSLVPPFVQEHELDFPILMGSLSMSDRYDATAIPTNILVDPEGNIRARHVGFLARDVDRWFAYWTGLLEPMLQE